MFPMARLSSAERKYLKGLRSGAMQPRDDLVRDGLIQKGLVEMKLGGWGLTRKGVQRAIFG